MLNSQEEKDETKAARKTIAYSESRIEIQEALQKSLAAYQQAIQEDARF